MSPLGLLRKAARTAFLLVISTVAVQAAGEAKLNARNADGCQIEKPAIWTGGKTTWTGNCARGHAEGLGVLESDLPAGSPELFAGYVEHGHLRRGVLVTEGGYVAGDWSNGAVVRKSGSDLDSRNVVLAAFQTAAKAAEAASKEMARRAHSARSRFFTKIANSLRDQMD